jgi:hypothetical protein
LPHTHSDLIVALMSLPCDLATRVIDRYLFSSGAPATRLKYIAVSLRLPGCQHVDFIRWSCWFTSGTLLLIFKPRKNACVQRSLFGISARRSRHSSTSSGKGPSASAASGSARTTTASAGRSSRRCSWQCRRPVVVLPHPRGPTTRTAAWSTSRSLSNGWTARFGHRPGRRVLRPSRC